jgi:predicted MPP superfamily phosphohydrolase
MNIPYTKTSTLRLIYSLISIIILSVAVLPGSAAEYENKQQQYYAYATTTNTTTTTSVTSTLPDIINFNFAAVGDWGCKSETTDTVINILDKSPELILGLGDYDYYGVNADCWLERVQPIDDKMKIAIGNHEVEMESKLTQYIEHFNLTNQYYSFDYQNVHFIVMSDYVSWEIGSEQYRFVQNDLAKAATDPNIDWIMVTHHESAYISTRNYIVQDNDNYDFEPWKETYHPLFEQYNVDLVLQGHHHSYQRSYPIKYNVDTPRNPIITDRNTNTYTNPEGQIFATVGTGGAGLFPLNGNKAPYLITAQNEEHGFLNADVTNNNNNGTATLVGTFYSNNGGEMTDQFTITKSAAGDLPLPSPPPPPPELPAQEETEEDAAEEEGQEEDEESDGDD